MISVVIPVYNGEKTICRAIDSALAQQTDTEILVIDDCSVDHTMAVLQPYIQKGQIRCYQNTENSGVAASRNRGVSLARGEYIAFLDADDAWQSGKLNAQLERLDKTGCVICSTARRLICPGNPKDGQVIHMPAKVTYHDLLGCNHIACSSVLVQTDVAKEFPMACDSVHEDYLTWLRILKKYRVCAGIDQPYLDYSLSTSGKSGGKLHSAAMTYGVYKKAGLSLPQCVCSFIRYAFHGIWNYYGPKKHKE